MSTTTTNELETVNQQETANEQQEAVKKVGTNNFFTVMAATQGYRDSKESIRLGMDPGHRKVYNNMKKMLREGYLVGSLKYGNNFIM